MVRDGNPVRNRWEGGEAALGGWCVIPSALSAEMLAQRGFDWIGLDWQHGFMDLETTASMISAISITGAAPLVRVAFNEPWMIGKALDMGAYGVIVPLVNDRREAEAAVAACRYPPAGRRSFGPVKNAPAIGTDHHRCNQRVVCAVMIETREGFENRDEICSTTGLDAVFIGPDDLRISLGLEHGAPADEAVAHVLAACRRHGVVAGIHVADGHGARARTADGFLLIGIGSDGDFLAYSADSALTTARGATPEAAGPTKERTVQAVVWAGL